MPCSMSWQTPLVGPPRNSSQMPGSKVTQSTQPASAPRLVSLSWESRHVSVLTPGPTGTTWRCQSTSPEMLLVRPSPMPNSSQSKSDSEETFHQNVNLPGPVTMVCNRDCWKLPMAPLWTADWPLWVTLLWPNQGASPLVNQLSPVSSSDWPSAGRNGVTTSVMVRLVRI